MSNVLVVKAHRLSASKSRTLQGLATFIKSYKEVNPDDTITILDVFDDDIPEVDGPMLNAWNDLSAGVDFSTLTPEQQHNVARFNELTQLFLDADKIIVANALWNLNIPTKLKAWIDTIMVAGKTFRYTENGPVPMTSGKKVFHIQSNGGVYHGEDFSNQYLKTIFNFVGCNHYDAAFIEGLDYDPEHADQMLNTALSNISAAAKQF